MLITRGVVVASTVLAALVECYLATPYAPPVFFTSIIAFALLAALGSRIRGVAMPVVMAAMYVMPAIYLIFRDGEDFSLDIIWILPLLGLCLSDRGALAWSLPRRWQWPLVTWSMIVAISWPIVFLREADFALWILPLQRVSNTSIGVSPWQVGLNITYFVIGHNVGILFVDAMCRWYANARESFRREVLLPQLAAAAVAAMVAFYQGFVDLSFLNHHFWTYMIRAAGTLGDPNKLGAVSAFWTVGAIVYARKYDGTKRLLITIGALVAGISAVWLSGSRTGLAAVGVSVTIAAVEFIRAWWTTRSTTKISAGRVLAGGVALIVVAAGVVAMLNQASTHTIKARGTLFYLPFYGDKSIKESANELLWERFGYGPAAIQMIKEHPIEGVGVGMFHTLVMDYGKVRGYSIPTDNAQNWFRHVIAEFGIAGSTPMLWWCAVLVMLMFSGTASLPAALLRGVLIGFGVASMFGMPAQSIAIVMTFWVFAFWLKEEKGSGIGDQGSGNRDQGSGGERNAWSKRAVIAAALLIAVHAGATTANAFGDLRPRERAQRFNWYYRYGYHINDSDGYDREPDPGGNPIMRRWTMKQSLAVIPVQGKVLKFVAWVDHPDKDTHPVHTQVWADSKLVYEGDLRAPMFLDIPATPGKTHMVIETKVDRTFRPSDDGKSRDSRELGLSIRDWTWQ